MSLFLKRSTERLTWGDSLWWACTLRAFEEVKAPWAKKSKEIEHKLRIWRLNDGEKHTRRKEEVTDWKMVKKKLQRENNICLGISHHDSSQIYYNDVIIAHCTHRGLWDMCVKSGYLTCLRWIRDDLWSGFHSFMGHRPIWDTNKGPLTQLRTSVCGL